MWLSILTLVTATGSDVFKYSLPKTKHKGGGSRRTGRGSRRGRKGREGGRRGRGGRVSSMVKSLFSLLKYFLMSSDCVFSVRHGG